jgi:hypothetical protein
MRTSKHLATWVALNEALRTITETECWSLLKAEQTGKRRVQFLLRIYGRANRLRTERERSAMLAPRPKKAE